MWPSEFTRGYTVYSSEVEHKVEVIHFVWEKTCLGNLGTEAVSLEKVVLVCSNY